MSPINRISILTMLSSVLPAYPQRAEPAYQTYFGGELGTAFAHDVEYGGFSRGVMAGVTTSRWRYELNYVYLEERNPDGLIRPLHEFRHLGFDIGRVFRDNDIYLTPGVGIGYLTGSFRIRQIGRKQICNYNSYGWCVDPKEGAPIYEYHSVDALTFVPSIKALYKPFNHFGIGLNASGYINSDQGIGKLTAFAGLFY